MMNKKEIHPQIFLLNKSYSFYLEFHQLLIFRCKVFHSNLHGQKVTQKFSHLRYLLSSHEEGGLQNLKYPLVSDLTKTITNDYNLLTDDGMAFPGFNNVENVLIS